MNTEDKAIILKELEGLNQHFGTIATASESGAPEAATMYFLHDEDLNIYFITRSGSRKYENLLKNPKTAFVVSGQHPSKTIQIEGVSSEVLSPDEQLKYYEKLSPFLFQNNPVPPVGQMVGGEMVLMKLTPTWMRLGNFEEMREGDKFLEISL